MSEHEDNKFVLQTVQPGLAGLMDGSVSTLAPIFAVAFATHNPHFAFVTGLAAAVGAGISMAFAEALSDDGKLTGRGHPFRRGVIRYRFFDMKFWLSILQVVVGGALVFVAGVLIGQA
jgi:rubrerythrin